MSSYYYLDKEKLYTLLQGLEDIYRRLDNNTFARIDVDELIAGSISVEDTVTVGRDPVQNMEVATKNYVDSLVDGIAGKKIRYATTAQWNAERTLVGENEAIYVYTDYKTYSDVNGNTIKVPGIKIGDGHAYLVDLPFLAANEKDFLDHVNDHTVHITQAEREFWNNKVRSKAEGENLILTIH